MNYHYTYLSLNGKRTVGYIGCRSCACLPKEDTKYFGSGAAIKDGSFIPVRKIILKVFETRAEALECEIFLHNYFDVAVNPDFANRAKQTSTKFDITGTKHTEEWKHKKSKQMSGEKNPMRGRTGEKNPMYNKKHTEEAKQKISDVLKGKKREPFSEARKQKLSEANSGEKNPASKLSDADTQEIIDRYNKNPVFGMKTKLAREFGVSNATVCRILKSGCATWKTGTSASHQGKISGIIV